MAGSLVEVNLTTIEATPENFKDYGQIIEAHHGKYGPNDAQLDLSRGIPRLYIVHLDDTSSKFSKITHHANVTQCLGPIGDHVWYLGVAKASLIEDPEEIKEDGGRVHVQAKSGHFYVPPAPEEVRVFRISGPKFVKLHRGTWHAGPFLKDSSMYFYNLELSNTNAVDFTTHDFEKNNGVVIVYDDK